jgi:hypothetical protein
MALGFTKRLQISWLNRLKKFKVGLRSPKVRKGLRILGSVVLGVSIFHLTRKVKIVLAVDLNKNIPEATPNRNWSQFFEILKKRFQKNKLLVVGSAISFATLLGLHFYFSAIELANEKEMNEIINAAIAKYYETKNNKL